MWESNRFLNNFAISSDGIAEGLQRSASTLVAAGNSLEQSIAMLAAGNKVAQDPEALGNAIKVLSMRIRGTKTELAEAGEETEGLITNTSKLRDKVKALTNVNGNGGVDILTDTGAYRSTYDILLDIAEVWDDINDADPKNQAALLEILAGKTRGSQLAAILQNPEDLRDAYEMALESEGSALKELDTYLDSIQGKMQQFTNSVQTMWMNMLESKTIKGLVDLGTALVKIADKVGVINILFAALTTSLMRKAGIKNISAFFTTTVAGAEEAQKKLDELKTQYKNLNGATSKKDIIKREQIRAQMKPYETIVTEAEKAKTAQDNLTKAQDRLNKAQRGLEYAKKHKYPTKSIENYQKNVKKAEENLHNAEIAQKKLGSSGKIAFAKLKIGVQNFSKQLKGALTQMATMFLISKVIEGVVWLFDKLKETVEESKEKFDNLVSELDSTKSGLDDLESKLEDINKQIEEINDNTPLSFTDEEDLKRLKAESAELEQQIEFQKMLAEQQQGKVNQEAVKQAGKYKQTVGDSGKTSDEIVGDAAGTGALIGGATAFVTGGAAAISTAFAGSKIGGTLGSFAGPIGTAIGLAAGAVIGAVIGGIVGHAQVAYEGETVGTTLENMDENYANLEKKMVDARNKALKTGSEKDQEAYEKAQENFTNFKANVANYFAEMGTYFDQMDMETATESEKKAYEEYKNLQDKWAIINNGDDAAKNALDRLFGEDADEVVKAYRDKIKNDIQNGETVDFQEMIDVTGLDDDLDAIGLTTQDVADYFTKLGKAGADAVEKIDFSDVVSELAKVEGALESMKSVMEEFQTEGIVSASTLDGLDESIKNLDVFDAYAEALMSGTATMADVKKLTEELAKELLDNADNITNDNKLTYIAQLEKFGIENAKELVESYIKQDFFDITNIQSATTGFGKLSDEIAEAADAYDDIIEKDTTWSKGNVDYSNRPIVSAETMQEKYPEFDSDDAATTYDMDKAILNSEGNTAYTVKVTPILEDGTVIDEKTLTEYVEGVLQDAYNKGGLEGVLEADKNGYNIVIATTTEKVEYDDNGFSVLDKALQGAKDSHLELVNTSAQGLIDLAAEKGIVLELADAYKILQAAENARAKQAKRDSEVLANATAEKNNQDKQEIANMLRTDEKYKEFRYLFNNIEQIENREGYYQNYKDQQAEQAITTYKERLESYLSKYGYTLADAFPELEILPQITVSQEEVDAANKKYHELIDGMDWTITPRVDMNPADTIEEISDIESGFEALSGAYNEFLEEGVTSAGTLAGLKDTFDVVGMKDEYAKLVTTLGNSNSTIEQVKASLLDLANAYLNTIDITDQMDASEKQMIIEQLTRLGVEGAEAWLNARIAAYGAILEAYKIDLNNYNSAEEAKAAIAISAALGIEALNDDLVRSLMQEYQNDLSGFTSTEAEKVEAAKEAAKKIAKAHLEAASLADYNAQVAELDVTTNADDLRKEQNLARKMKAGIYAEGALKAYNDAVARIDSMGTLDPNDYIGDWFGNDTSIDWGKFKELGDGSDSDSSTELDWLDHYFTKIENKIKEKEADLENVMSADIGSIDDKKTIIDGIIGLYESKMSLLENAIKAYNNRATALFNGFSSDIQNKIRNGSIDINEYDNELAEDIQNYFDYITKASDLGIELDGVKVTVADFSLQKFDNAATAFDNEIEEKFQSDQDLIEAEIGYLEEQGKRVSPELYEKLIKVQKEEQKVLENKKKTLENILATEIAAGHVQIGSEQWYEMAGAINDVDEALIESKNDIESFQNSINEIYWDNFEKLIDQIDAVNSELSNLFDLLSEDDKVVDEFGNWTDEGIASLGLLAQQMETSKAKTKEYKKAISDLENTRNNYSLDEYNEKMAELKDNYLSELKNIEDLKDAIVDLNKVRVEAIKEGIDKEIEAYDELIEKKLESLDADKDAHDWQKQIQESNKSISDIQRKINALAGDTSASAIAERRKLEAELAEAKAELEEAYYDRSIEQQKEALSKEQENYKDTKDKEKEDLDEWLENEEAVLQESFDLFKSNIDAVSDVLTGFENEHGIKLSDAVTEPWKNGIDAMAAYRQKLAEMKQEQENAKQNAEDTADDIAGSIDKPQTTAPTTSQVVNKPSASNPTTNKSNTTTPSVKSPPGYGSTVTVKKSATNFSRNGGNGTKMQSWVPGSSFTVYQSDSDEVLIGRNGGYTGWVKLSDIEGYYKGTTGVKDDQWAFTDELGPELTLHAGPNGQLQYLTKGSSVVTADLTKRLMEWGELDPSQVLKNSAPKLGAPHITTNNMEINLRINEVVHIDHADSNSIQDITSAVQKQMDQYMKNVNQSLKRFKR